MVDRVARFLEITSAASEAATMDEISQHIGDGEGLPAICKGWDVPYGRVLSWLMADEKRYAVYERALEVAAHALVSETVAISDGEPRIVMGPDGEPVMGDDGKPLVVETDVPRSRVRIDTRFRAAQFHAREKYGERAQQGAVLPHVQINIGVRTVAAPVVDGAVTVNQEGEIDAGI